jgi:hypothetical protein
LPSILNAFDTEPHAGVVSFLLLLSNARDYARLKNCLPMVNLRLVTGERFSVFDRPITSKRTLFGSANPRYFALQGPFLLTRFMALNSDFGEEFTAHSEMLPIPTSRRQSALSGEEQR